MTRRAVVLSLALVLASGGAAAQTVQRQFPATALRGEIVFGQPPEALLNGQPARLAPAARIRGLNNLIVMSGALIGQKAVAHYVLDSSGLLKEVWILTDRELARQPWPTTAAQARSWKFDPVAQVWVKP
ncbi:MAG TPA: hypothetical protein VFZ28_12010 [Burkholderiaceae bacterium]|nr:hypothetical protein [Burkholderiaceae bacterium]